LRLFSASETVLFLASDTSFSRFQRRIVLGFKCVFARLQRHKIMATKRTHSAMDVVHPSRQAQVPGSARPSKKPRRMGPPVHKKQAHASSVNTIKKRIRDVKRRLERSQNLPATIRVENERALAAYEQELAAADEEKMRQKMIKKYHMVRFFGMPYFQGIILQCSHSAERQKATRQLKKLRRRLIEAQSEEEVTTIKGKMHIAEVDLSYTQYYPLYQRYVSLYPQRDADGSESGHQDEHVEDSTKKPPMWAEVEKRMVEGTLNQLRNGSSTTIPSQGKSRSSKLPAVKSKPGSVQSKLSGTSAKHSQDSTRLKESAKHPEHHSSDHGKRGTPKKTMEARNEDDESDGGFFEE
jgi:hypothetical protein